MNGPLALLLRYYSEVERRKVSNIFIKALKTSNVKVLGKDVVASNKIVASLIIMPISIILFTFLFSLAIKGRKFAANGKGRKLTLLFFFLWPIYVSCKKSSY